MIFGETFNTAAQLLDLQQLSGKVTINDSGFVSITHLPSEATSHEASSLVVRFIGFVNSVLD